MPLKVEKAGSRGGHFVKIDTHRLVSMTEANQNFSRVARLVNETGSAVILKNNHPRYLVLDFERLGETVELPQPAAQEGSDMGGNKQ